MITIKLDDKKYQRSMRNVRQYLKNRKQLLKVIGEREVKTAQKRITTTKLAPSGQWWRPWTYATLQQRVREGNVSLGLLYRTGTLLNSFKYKVSIRKIEISNTAPYAGYLQFGTRNMPARKILGWGKDSIRFLKLTIRQQVTKKWK